MRKNETMVVTEKQKDPMIMITKRMTEPKNPTMLKIMRRMEVKETPEIGEDSTINEESESESIQDGYGDSNPDSFPTEEEVEL